MKAAVFYECGGTDKIQVVDRPRPTIKPNEVLIEIKAAALNHHDLWMLRGPADSNYMFPYCGGSDLSGVIAEVGEDIDEFKAGTRVIVNPNLGCGVCVPVCPEGALVLVRRPEEEVMPIPVSEREWMYERADARGLDIRGVL